MSDINQFSEREKEVTALLMQGKSNKQIALALGISASTVEYHLKNVYKKLGVNSRTEAVLRLGKSTGGAGTGPLGKSTVERKGRAADNGVQPVSTWRFPLGKGFLIIASSLLAVACVVMTVLNNMPVQNVGNAPTSVSSLPDMTITSMVENPPTNGPGLPDLVISSVYVSMVDSNGTCLPFYGLNVTVFNRGDVPATDVLLMETNTGGELGLGTLNPLQSVSTSFMANGASGGAYTVIVDPHNAILESDEANNSATFSDATATPVAFCPPLQYGTGVHTAVPSIIPSMTMPVTDVPSLTPMPSITLRPSPTSTVVSNPQPTSVNRSLPDLIVKFMYVEMEGRQGNCVRAYRPYEIRVLVQNIGLTNAGPFVVDLNGSRQQVNEGLGAGQYIRLHFAGTAPSGRYGATIDPLGQVRERDENNNIFTYVAPTPTPPLLCTATPMSTP
jgi:DNA-binding CsgD family transcriptional regulator